jgi:hypothetical protein
MNKIYIVMANEDRTEGRGRNVPYYYCNNAPLAELLAKGMGPMGASDGYVEEVWLLEELEDRSRAVEMKEIKKRALAKLTAEEKKALDLK